MDLYKAQETIEQQSNYETILRFNNDLSNKKQTGTESATYYGHPLLKRAIEPFAISIDKFLIDISSPEPILIRSSLIPLS